jgi:hypothetical protein
MSFKGNMRTAVAIARRMERAEKRRANEAARHYKALLKLQEFENGQRIVQEYEEYIELISSTHKETSEPIDWQEVLEEQAPTEPTLTDNHQKSAQTNLANYKPLFFDKLFGLTAKKIKKLEDRIQVAKLEDQKQLEKEQKEYDKNFAGQSINKWQKALLPKTPKHTKTYLNT